MIGNHLISHLSWAYGGFSATARDLMEPSGSVYRVQKASGDLFEAFVGALVQDSRDGLHLLVRWIRDMITSGALPSIGPEALRLIELEKHRTQLGKRGYDQVD